MRFCTRIRVLRIQAAKLSKTSKLKTQRRRTYSTHTQITRIYVQISWYIYQLVARIRYFRYNRFRSVIRGATIRNNKLLAARTRRYTTSTATRPLPLGTRWVQLSCRYNRAIITISELGRIGYIYSYSDIPTPSISICTRSYQLSFRRPYRLSPSKSVSVSVSAVVYLSFLYSAHVRCAAYIHIYRYLYRQIGYRAIF